METAVTIFQISDNLSIGLHACLGANLEYCRQVSLDIYTCLARNKRISKNTGMVIISLTGERINAQAVNQKKINDVVSIENWEQFFSEKKTMDLIRVTHNDFSIIQYLPIFDTDISEETKGFALKVARVLSKNNIDFEIMESNIWEKLQGETTKPIRKSYCSIS